MFNYKFKRQNKDIVRMFLSKVITQVERLLLCSGSLQFIKKDFTMSIMHRPESKT